LAKFKEAAGVDEIERLRTSIEMRVGYGQIDIDDVVEGDEGLLREMHLSERDLKIILYALRESFP
jgi:hypothetical protein